VRLRNGFAAVHSLLFPWWAPVVVGIGPIRYGDLDGDGHAEAAATVNCSNGGGTAAGQLRFAGVIYSVRARTLRTLAVVAPRQPYTGPAHVPLLIATIAGGRVIAHESWYGPADGDCCASGRAHTIWRYAHGRLRVVRTVVDRPPKK
jgi:hypothetical protein